MTYPIDSDEQKCPDVVGRQCNSEEPFPSSDQFATTPVAVTAVAVRAPVRGDDTPGNIESGRNETTRITTTEALGKSYLHETPSNAAETPLETASRQQNQQQPPSSRSLQFQESLSFQSSLGQLSSLPIPKQPPQHPTPMGKKPPPSGKRSSSRISGKTINSNKKRRPIFSSGKKAGRGRPPKRSLSRQGSSNLSTFSRNSTNINYPKATIVNDEEPDRLTNPLLAMVPECNKQTLGCSSSVSAADSSSSTTLITIPVADLLNSSSIVFHRPDTYPLSYLARVLGFDVEVPDLRRHLKQQYQDAAHPSLPPSRNAGSDVASVVPPFPTPLPDPQTLPFRRDEIFFKVPKLGTYFEQSKLQKFVDHTGGLGDRDDHRTLDYMDPVYKILLRDGWDANRAKPFTSGATAKFKQQRKVLGPVWDEISQMGREMLGMSDDWTFQDWASYERAQEENDVRQQNSQGIRESPVTTFTSSLSGTGSPNRSSSKRRTSKGGGLLWMMDDKQMFRNLPLHQFGILACYKGLPAAILKYQFLWYYLPTELKNERSKDKQRNDSSNQALEAELIMMINGFGRLAESDILGSPPTTPQEEDSWSSDVNREKETPPIPVVTLLPTTSPMNKVVETAMISMALEHTRTCNIWYAVWDVPSSLEEPARRCFRMVPLLKSSVISYSETSLGNDDGNVINQPSNASPKYGVPMICDLKKCSYKYALLNLRDFKEYSATNGQIVTEEKRASPDPVRLLISLPTLETVKRMFVPGKKKEKRADTRKQDSVTKAFTSASEPARELYIRFRGNLMVGDGIEFYREDSSGEDKMQNSPLVNTSKPISRADSRSRLKSNNRDTNDNASLIDTFDGYDLREAPEQDDRLSKLQLGLLRYFPIASAFGDSLPCSEDEVLIELQIKQNELLRIEQSLQPVARSLLAKAMEDRIEYEQPIARHRRVEAIHILKRHEENVKRRMELDQVWQDQLEQDMNAVCSICDDGEVTPENQILFCEACNVAVHQMCYGIEKIPVGDYYCIACRYFKRDKLIEAMSNRQLSMTKELSRTSRGKLDPLPIWCELCPVKKGAYTRTAFPATLEAKWLHMTCAKWQGLDFVKRNDPSLVEDVTELRHHFRRLEITCCICQGMRGAYNKCRHPDCKNWCHVTCARESGLCEVIHGEDVVGFVEENPWTLLCPSHSDKKQEKGESDRKRTSIEFLVKSAKEFPVEPMPPPRPESLRPFNKLSASERKEALGVRSYEDKFIEEVLTKKLAGVRCEVCDVVEEDGKNLSRCVACGCVVCFACQIIDDPDMREQRSFKCFGCRSFEKNVSVDEKDAIIPQCSMCHQKGGLLLPATANPLSKKSYWKHNPKELKRSLFGTMKFAHVLCSFWSPNIRVNHSNCSINASNVVMANGRQFVKGRTRCGLCGLRSGLKTRCLQKTCRARGETKLPFHFHITCARQAGLEASHDDDPEKGFYLKCYIHGSNEHNLRARLEDLIEVERRRLGKKLLRIETPMTFSDGCRLLNNAILVMRILGWAWRWAEWWVEYGSTWEPLLEPGQNEAKMTAEELRIVESTKEDRKEDARRCRLAALGAALRNRSYDVDGGFDTAALDRALRSLLHTSSLVGPLEQFEIDFFTEWLGRAYRSRSRLLGFGEDKIPVSKDGFCLHSSDKSPKFELGSRPLPGTKPSPQGQIFESSVDEPDDFLLPERSEDGELLDADPFDEVNYSHKRKVVANESVTSGKRPSQFADNVKSPPRKKRKVRRPKPVAQEQARRVTTSSRNESFYPYLEAVILRNKLTRGLTFFEDHQGDVLKLRVVLRVTGEDEGDLDCSIDAKSSSSSELDYVNIDLSDVLPQQVEFLEGIGITTTVELMSSPTQPIASKFIAHRDEKGLPPLKGRNSYDGAAKTVCKWRSIVKAFAKKIMNEGSKANLNHGIKNTDRTKDSFSPGLQVVGQSEMGTGRDENGVQAVQSETEIVSIRSVSEDATDLGIGRIRRARRSKTTRQKGNDEWTDSHSDRKRLGESKEEHEDEITPRSRSLDEKEPDSELPNTRVQQHDESLDDTMSAITGEEERDFLSYMGITTAHKLLEASTTRIGNEFATWRARKRLKKYFGRSVFTRVSAWKKQVRDSDVVGRQLDGIIRKNDAATITSPSENNAEGDGAELTHASKISRKRKREKSIQINDELLGVLPAIPLDFLHDENIISARCLLAMQTIEVAEKFMRWRETNGLLRYSRSSASAVVSSWKTRVRKAAFDLGDNELAMLNFEVRRARKTREKKLKEASTKEEIGDDSGNDLCLLCGEGGDLVICDGCEKSCHLGCLVPSLTEVPEGDFYCPECENKAVEIDDDDMCMICGECGDLLICDGCEQSCHMACLDPPLSHVPEGDFYCPECSRKPAALVAPDAKQEGGVEGRGIETNFNILSSDGLIQAKSDHNRDCEQMHSCEKDRTAVLPPLNVNGLVNDEKESHFSETSKDTLVEKPNDATSQSGCRDPPNDDAAPTDESELAPHLGGSE